MSVPDFFFGRVRAAGFRAVATVLAGWRVALVTFAGFRRGPPDLFPAAVFLAFDFAFLAVDLAVFFMATLDFGRGTAGGWTCSKCRNKGPCSRPFLPEEFVPAVFAGLQVGCFRLKVFRVAPLPCLGGQAGGETSTEPGFETLLPDLPLVE